MEGHRRVRHRQILFQQQRCEFLQSFLNIFLNFGFYNWVTGFQRLEFLVHVS